MSEATKTGEPGLLIQSQRDEWEAKWRQLGADQYEHPWTVNEAAQLRPRAQRAEFLLALALACCEQALAANERLARLGRIIERERDQALSKAFD